MASKAKKGLAAMLIVGTAITAAACEEAPAPTQGEQSVRTTASEITAEKTTETSETTTKPEKAEKTEKTTAEEKPANLEGMKINTDLLEDFGLTLSELEKKYGEAVKGEADYSNSKNESMPRTVYTYYFENKTIGYSFWIDEPLFDVKIGVNTDENLTDGTPRVKEIDEWGRRITGAPEIKIVKDVFLGFDKTMTVEEFKKIYEIEIYETHCLYSDDVHGEYYTANGIYYTDHDLIKNYDFFFGLKKDGIIEPDCFLIASYDPYGAMAW